MEKIEDEQKRHIICLHLLQLILICQYPNSLHLAFDNFFRIEVSGLLAIEHKPSSQNGVEERFKIQD